MPGSTGGHRELVKGEQPKILTVRLLAGEGAGKTEASKHIMQYIAVSYQPKPAGRGGEVRSGGGGGGCRAGLCLVPAGGKETQWSPAQAKFRGCHKTPSDPQLGPCSQGEARPSIGMPFPLGMGKGGGEEGQQTGTGPHRDPMEAERLAASKKSPWMPGQYQGWARNSRNQDPPGLPAAHQQGSVGAASCVRALPLPVKVG